EEMMRGIFVNLLCLFCMNSVEASQSIVINNSMHDDLLIEDVNTKGSIVTDAFQLIDKTLKSTEKTMLHINIVSPICDQQDNFATLKIKDKHVFITWGKEGVNLGDSKLYVLSGFYRITQELDVSGNIVFSFYDDDTESKTALLNAAKARLKVITTQQQKSSRLDTIRYSGVTEEELQSK
ncbi:MAG: hypothetical protein IJ730_01340, partial [Alphaproteobacteria bacterium]|nr:hypothetical protein [Alphaproteobacteria bacterium]